MVLMSVVLRSILAVLMLSLSGTPTRHASQAPTQGAIRTRVVLLGTGTPVPDPDRSGPATVITADYRAYLVDFGPGVIRRAEAAALKTGITAVEPGRWTEWAHRPTVGPSPRDWSGHEIRGDSSFPARGAYELGVGTNPPGSGRVNSCDQRRR